MDAIGGNRMNNSIQNKLVWVVTGLLTVLCSAFCLASDIQTVRGCDPEIVFQIQKATSLVEIATYLQSSNATSRELALGRWEVLPIRLNDLDNAKRLRTSFDRAVKRYAIMTCADIQFLQDQKAYRDIVLGNMETTVEVTNLYQYLNGRDEMLRRFALMKWKRTQPRVEDRACVETLMTNADWRVAQMAVVKFWQLFQTDADARQLTEVALRKGIPASIKVEIVRELSQIRNATSDQCIRMILESSLRQKPTGDIKYAYRYPDYYDVSKAAIEALAQSQSEDTKRFLKTVAGDDSIYSGLRQQTVKAMEKKE